MKMLIKEEKVFDYSELSQEAKDNVINDTVDFYCDIYLYNDMYEFAKDLVNNEFPHSNLDNIYYDLSYSQGSGAIIEISYDNFDSYLEDNKELKTKLSLSQQDIDMTYFKLKIKQYGLYVNENAYDVSYDIEFPYNVDKAEERLNYVYDSINENFNKKDFRNSNVSKYYKMNVDLSKEGYSLIEDRQKFEDMVLGNDIYYYYENGKYACEKNDYRLKDEKN